MSFIFNALLKLTKRQQITFHLTIAIAFKLQGGNFICWLGYGFSFWVFLRSISAGIDIPLVPSMGAFIIAYQIGYLARFGPGRLAPVEFVSSTPLTPFLAPLAVGITVAARIWNMVVEIIALVTAWRIKTSLQN